MEPFWLELFSDLPDGASLARVFVRLLLAAGLGGILGYERQKEGKSAGIRTHALVALGAALLIVVGTEKGMNKADLSRIVQGIVTGIGFLGAGTIVKLTSEQSVRGLTSAVAFG
jgi:putative Mg2+ transporter-C (MgtC) family protein